MFINVVNCHSVIDELLLTADSYSIVHRSRKLRRPMLQDQDRRISVSSGVDLISSFFKC